MTAEHVTPCEEARERALAGTPDEAHLRACTDCQAFVRDAERLHAALGTLLEVPPARVWAKLAEPPAARRWTARWLATAAGVAAVAAALLWSAPVPVTSPTPSPAVVRAAVPPAAVHADIDAELESARAEIEWLDRDIQRF